MLCTNHESSRGVDVHDLRLLIDARAGNASQFAETSSINLNGGSYLCQLVVTEPSLAAPERSTNT